ncbi:hypothetical protein G8C92_06510 [Paenibacillus donghaensis]|uniref:hypothetical protein n=1 Tax=Paenibacillus donghaensis TaxID=414771 RepID=UPI0018835849|nr:hypothetical protein [Paenibacillus donghaensis]MBE9913682.1 hypothetical protein [Paenibacillus donghaensis]
MRFKMWLVLGLSLLLSACGKDPNLMPEQYTTTSNTKVNQQETLPVESESNLPDRTDSLVKAETDSDKVDNANPDVDIQSTTVNAQTDEEDAFTLDYSKINSIGNWKFGTPFSLAKSKLKGMKIGYDAANNEFASFYNDDYYLTFYKGLLFEITVSKQGKGIPGLVAVGDDETSVKNKFGPPLTKMDYGVSIDYDYGSYAEPPLSIKIQENKVVAIRMNKDTEGDQKEHDILLGYLNKPTDTTPQEKTPVQQDEPKAVTFDEYVKISDDLLNALVQYTQTMSKGITDKEKIKKLKELDTKYGIYNLSMMFENAVPADEQNSDLHMRCKMLVDKVDSLFVTGQFYLSQKINKDDPKNIAAWEKQAREELQEVWAWVNQG